MEKIEHPASIAYAVGFLLLLLCNVSAQIRYSITEEDIKRGSIVGNVAKDLGLDLAILKERGFRIVSGSNEQH
uniref:Cadherin N-terminal domain-containing protein n=1 Tax=Gadus morhua TaxID=8049 RepID=A0A8C5B6D9_GADMO